MKSRVAFVLLCLAVAYAGRNVVHQVRVLADGSRPRELDARVSAALVGLADELPDDVVVRFREGAEHHSLMAQLRYELAPRRVVLDGKADLFVTRRHPARDGDVVCSINEEFSLCRTPF